MGYNIIDYIYFNKEATGNKMKKTRKITYLFTMILIILLILSSCKTANGPRQDNNKEESLETKISYKTIAYKIDLLDSSDKMKDNNAIADYLMSWADSKSVNAVRDHNGNIIMGIKATPEYQDEPLSVVVCPYDALHYEECVNNMALSLYLARNAEGYGSVQLIFTPSIDGDFSGVSTLPSTLFPTGCRVFCLTSGTSPSWSFNSGGINTYKFKGAAKTKAPEGDMALKISISGLPDSVILGYLSSYANPIKEFGDLLAHFKSTASIFELASMSGGSKSYILPSQAEMVIVINQDDYEKFSGKISSSIDKYMEKNSEAYPDLSYTCEEVPVPDSVYDQNTLNTFVSTLYSLLDGVYSLEDDKVISMANLGLISCSSDSYTIEAAGCSPNPTSLSDLDTDYKTICSLAGIEFEKTSYITPFEADLKDESYMAFNKNCSSAYKDFTNDSLHFESLIIPTSANILKTISPSCLYVNIAMDDDSLENDTGAIMTFIMKKHKSAS